MEHSPNKSKINQMRCFDITLGYNLGFKDGTW